MVVVAGDRDTAEMIRSRIEQRQEEQKSEDKGGLKLRSKKRSAASQFHG